MLPPHPQTRHYYSSTSAVTAAITADPAEFGAPVLTADACGRGLPWPHAHTHTGRRVASATPGGLSAGSLWALAAHSTPSSAPRPCSCHAGQTRACDAAVRLDWGRQRYATPETHVPVRFSRSSFPRTGQRRRGPGEGIGVSEGTDDAHALRCRSTRAGEALAAEEFAGTAGWCIEIFVAPVPPQIPIFMVSLYKVL